MKLLRKISVAVLGVCLCCGYGFAENVLDYEPDAWDYAVNGSGFAQINTQGEIELNCAGLVQTNSEVDTSRFKVGGQIFEITFDLSLDGLGEGCERSVLLRDGDENITFELLRIQGDSLTLFNQQVIDTGMPEHEKLSFCFAFDLSDGYTGAVQMNGTTVFDSTLQSWNQELNLEDMYIRFRNYTTVSQQNSFAARVDNVTASVHNAPPMVEITGITDGEIFRLGELILVSIGIKDDYGMEKAELYIDGVLKKTYDTVFEDQYSLEGLSYGTHSVLVSAYDMYGEKTEKFISIIVTGDVSEQTFAEDFKDIDINGTASVTTSNGIKVLGQRGYYKTLTIDPEHGNSLAVGIEKANQTETGSAWMGIPTGGMTEDFTYECEFYVSKKATDYTIRFKKDNGTEIYAITLNDTMNCGSVKGIAYDEGAWNSLKIVVDIANPSYTVYLNQSLVAEKIPMNAIEQIDYIRFFGPASDSIPTYLAIDNIVITKNIQLPQFKTITYHKQMVEAELTKSLYQGAFTKNNIAVISEFGEKAGIVSALCSGSKIQVELDRELKSNTRYSFVLNADTEVSAGVKLGHDMSMVFQTDCAGLEVKELFFSSEGAQTKANIELVNEEMEKKKIYVIAAVWEGDTFLGSSAEVYEAEADGKTKIKFLFDTPMSGQRTEIYIKDALVQGKTLANRIYTVSR